MNIFKRITAIILIGLMIISGGVLSVSAEETDMKLNGSVYAIQFNAGTGFDSIDFYVDKGSVTGNRSLTAELYKWDSGYSKTLKGTPVVHTDYETVILKSFNTFECPCTASGEYLFVLRNASKNLYITVTSPKTDNTRTYMNGSVYDGGTLKINVNFSGSGSFGPISDNTVSFVDTSSWVATDMLGRTVDNSYVNTTRKDKKVGVFFHTWHSSMVGMPAVNITEYLKNHPGIQNDYDNPLWNGVSQGYWNEPIWGYYRSDDEWVLRRQAELLADAQVDVVFFDNTNGTVTFIDDALTLCKVWSQARADGVKTPQICFMLPMFDYNDVASQIREIYTKLYSKGLYQELWFYWDGKPLIVGYPGELNKNNKKDKEILDFFTYRVIDHSQSRDNVQVQDRDGNPLVMGAIQQEIKDNYVLWNWISAYPQRINKDKEGNVEEMAVAIAHNWCKETHLTAMNNPTDTMFNRTYMPKEDCYDTRENAKCWGAYFQEQWELALEIDPEFIWITGWNEWTAGRYDDFWGVENAFPDQFSDECSRDIEPSTGDLKDCYYYQMCYYIRKFKGISAAEPLNTTNTVDFDDPSAWDNVGKTYESYQGDTFNRDANGHTLAETGKQAYYSDTTGRNDIVGAKAAYDDEYVYFMCETAEDITPYTDPAWMRLFIEIQEAGGQSVTQENWETFNYVVNRVSPSDSSTAVLEVSKGGWNWETVGNVLYKAEGNRIQIRIPRESIGVDGQNFVLNFKWSDNMQVEGDIMDFYTHGDAAPEGRFKYQLAAGAAPIQKTTKKSSKISGKLLGIMAGCIGAAALAVIATVAGLNKDKKVK